MPTDESPAWILLLVGAIAVVGLVLSATTFYGHTTFGGMMGGGSGMMGGTTSTPSTGPGAFEWGILIVSAALFAGALFLWYRAKGRSSFPAAIANLTPAPAPPAATAPPPAPAPAEPLAEVTLVRLLDADERRMYLELRDHGGEMFQRDIVGLDIFSKAKVTRVLDKLENKGLVVREAHGMTNRVRLVKPPAK